MAFSRFCFTVDYNTILRRIQFRCPVSPFVEVLSNGQGKSGILSVRVFGWTGRRSKAENLYLHCTVGEIVISMITNSILNI